jgi:diguanylate cyclase (GGDEF)-like protein
MSSDPLKELGFGDYFALLRQLLPGGLDFYVCDRSGLVLAMDTDNTAPIARTRITLGQVRNAAVQDARSRFVLDRTDVALTCLMAIRTPADETAGWMVALGVHGNDILAEGFEAIVQAAFACVVGCMEKEYRLTIELNAMARELAGRYDELNLVYDTEDSTSIEQEAVTLRSLIENHVEYLDVDMVALIYPDRNRTLYVTGTRDPVLRPDELLDVLGTKFLPAAIAQADCMLINEIYDSRRDEYSLDIPYKLLSCPVINTRGDIEAVLVCLNHIYRKDFFNSDRNLLKVMGRKVAKITQANYDALTALMNQHAFETVLQRAIEDATSEGHFHCVLNMDIGRLQVINETYGRKAGDHVIRTVGELLRGKLRSTDTIGYLGEGRYGILLERTGIEQGVRVARIMRDHVQRHQVSWDSSSIDLLVTTGVVVVSPHSAGVGEVMESVELARTAAKELGAGQIQSFKQDDAGLATRRRNIHTVANIQKALRENRVMLHCQTIRPVVPSSEQFHFEVLIRLVDEDGALVSPDRFIPVAEQFNLMPAIDRRVIDLTLASLAGAGIARSTGQGVVSINLSGQSLADIELANYIIGKIRQYEIAADCICFEVTETVAIGNRNAALEIIGQLRAIGCRFSLDDFGTGLSSFSYLKGLPVDYVKIDGSFVRQVHADPVSAAMVASVIQIGHVMGLKTIAEYVENDAIAAQLTQMGVDYLQGYGIDKPSPLTGYLAALPAGKSRRLGQG